MQVPVSTDPRIERSRAVILEAAAAHFLRHGFIAANVDEIAAEARVSKRTVYNIFGGKEQLFREILGNAIDTAERFSTDIAGELGEAADPETALRDTGVRLARVVFGGRVVALRRLLIGETARFPELAADYYDRAPGRVMRTIAQALERFRERGMLDFDDAAEAAEHFAFLVMGAPLDRAMFITDTAQPDLSAIERRAERGVAVFLRAYVRPRRARA